MEQTLFYNNKIRTRACGIFIKNDKILLVEHDMKGESFFAPPGGGVEFGETLEETLKRELKEETRLNVLRSKFLFFTEYIKPPLHAIEVFYHIKKWSGIASKGVDPEDSALIKDIKWYSLEAIKKLKPTEVHHIFQYCNNLRDIFALTGYISYPTHLNK